MRCPDSCGRLQQQYYTCQSVVRTAAFDFRLEPIDIVMATAGVSSNDLSDFVESCYPPDSDIRQDPSSYSTMSNYCNRPYVECTSGLEIESLSVERPGAWLSFTLRCAFVQDNRWVVERKGLPIQSQPIGNVFGNAVRIRV